MARLYKGYIPKGAHWKHCKTIQHNKQEWLLYFNNETSDKNWREYKLLAKNRVRGTANYFLKYSPSQHRMAHGQSHLSLLTKRPDIYQHVSNFLDAPLDDGSVKYCTPTESQQSQFSRYPLFEILTCGDSCIYLMGEPLKDDGWVSYRVGGSINGKKRSVTCGKFLHNIIMSYNVFQMRYAFKEKVIAFQQDHPEIFAAINSRIESQIGRKTVSDTDRQIIKSFDLGALHVELSRANAGEWVSYVVNIKSGEGEKTFCCARNVATGELSQAKITGLQALQKFNDLVYYQVNKTILGIA